MYKDWNSFNKFIDADQAAESYVMTFKSHVQ